MHPLNFTLLLNVLNGTLLVTRPKGARECFANVDSNYERNSAWPDMWSRMDINRTAQPSTCTLSLDKWMDKGLVYVKFRYYFKNQEYYTIDNWIPVLPRLTIENFLYSYYAVIFTLCAILIILSSSIVSYLCWKNIKNYKKEILTV